MKKVLWFSRNELLPDQLDALKLTYGDDIEINHVNKTVKHMKEIKEDIDNADVIVMVGTVDMQSQALQLAAGKPVLTAMTDPNSRVVVKDPLGGESKTVFGFAGFKEVKNISVQKARFENKKTVLWFSRHDMSPKQMADLGIDENTNLIKIDRTINRASEIEAEIKQADIIAIVAPVGLQKQFLALADGKPVVTAAMNFVQQPDGTSKPEYDHWDQILDIQIEEKAIVTKEDLEKARAQGQSQTTRRTSPLDELNKQNTKSEKTDKKQGRDEQTNSKNTQGGEPR